MIYSNLNDAANHPDLGSFWCKGNVNIWYYKDENGRDACMGRKFCQKHGLFQIDPKDLAKTHVHLGGIQAIPLNDHDNVDHVFGALQGEIWSPQGEAREFIRSLGLSHTSMSIGDIIECEGHVYLVDNIGFIEL